MGRDIEQTYVADVINGEDPLHEQMLDPTRRYGASDVN